MTGKGIVQSDDAIDAVIESCQRFISNRENNEIIKIFNNAVDSFKPENADDLKTRLKDAVINSLIPGYEKIIADKYREVGAINLYTNGYHCEIGSDKSYGATGFTVRDYRGTKYDW